MKTRIVAILLFISTMLQADMFDKGNANIGVSMGAGSSFGENYTIFGVSASYFVVDNLNVGVAYRGWYGAEPTQNELSLATNYFVPLHAKFRPFVGVFTKKVFISQMQDYESLGARGGVAAVMSKNLFVSVGYAYEQFLNCPSSFECSNSYPEVVFSLSF